MEEDNYPNLLLHLYTDTPDTFYSFVNHPFLQVRNANVLIIELHVVCMIFNFKDVAGPGARLMNSSTVENTMSTSV